MQLEFSFHQLKLFGRLIKINWQQETAYFTNTLFGAITPLLYSLTFVLFINVLYQNIGSVAGYSKDEMLFILFMGQLNFYTYAFWGGSPGYMEAYVNNGAFDYILTKPVSSMFLITNHILRPVSTIINFTGPLLAVTLAIDWPSLNLYMNNLPYAVVIFVCGVYLYFTFQFIMSTISFWTGRGRQAAMVVFAASSQQIPLEGIGKGLRSLFLGVVPVMTTAVVASVMLGKSSPWAWTLIMVAIALVFYILKKFVWSKALQQYSSASS